MIPRRPSPPRPARLSPPRPARSPAALLVFSLPFAPLAFACGGSPSTGTGTGGAAGTSTSTSTTDSTSSGAGGLSTSSTSSTDSTSSSGGSSPTATGTGAAGSSGTGSSLPLFELDAHTSLSPGNALSLTTNLPAAVADCLSAPFTGTPCDDLDQDGLSDAWEALVLDRYRPLLRLDEQESLLDDPSFVIADIGRVALVDSAPLHVRVLLMIGYSKDFGSCGFTSHDGDSERVAWDLAATPGGGPGDLTALAAYTAAHENTVSDHSRLFAGPDLADLVFDADPATSEPRWVVFPSQDKHGTYASIAICEAISVLPCFDEDCAPDGEPDPPSFDRLPPSFNAGEEAHPLLTDLAPAGFPGDDAWADQDFCGGLGGPTCSAPVREKLLTDPF